MNWVRPVCVLLATLLVVFLQSSLSGLRQWLAAQPDFVPALVVYAALNASLATTAATAVLGGLGSDALSSGPFGLSVVPLVVLGVLLHLRRDLLLRDSPLAQALLGAAGALAVSVIWLVLFHVIWPVLDTPPPGPPHFPEVRGASLQAGEWRAALLWQLLVITLAGAPVTVLVFRLFGWVDAALDYQRAPEIRHRQDREIKRGRS